MNQRWLVRILLLLVVVLLVVVGISLFSDDDDISLAAGEPEIVSVSQLSDFAAESETPIYWLGERDDTRYELTETSDGRLYVRYLDAETNAGDERADFIAVATYPEENAVAALRRAADNREGAELGRTDDNAVLLIDPSSPKNAHLAYNGADLQIEVYSPVPGEALRLASKGEVQPVP
jgi:hypothetical protein